LVQLTQEHGRPWARMARSLPRPLARAASFDVGCSASDAPTNVVDGTNVTNKVRRGEAAARTGTASAD
jgi:hypothetical protein